MRHLLFNKSGQAIIWCDVLLDLACFGHQMTQHLYQTWRNSPTVFWDIAFTRIMWTDAVDDIICSSLAVLLRRCIHNGSYAYLCLVPGCSWRRTPNQMAQSSCSHQSLGAPVHSTLHPPAGWTGYKSSFQSWKLTSASEKVRNYSIRMTIEASSAWLSHNIGFESWFQWIFPSSETTPVGSWQKQAFPWGLLGNME